MPASHCRSSAADLRMRTAKLCNYFQKTKCVRTHLYFFAKKREAGASLFLVGFSRKTVKTVVPARGLPANPASGKAVRPGTAPDRYSRGGLTPGLATGPPVSLSHGAPVRCHGQKSPRRQNLPLRRNRSHRTGRPHQRNRPIGRATYADAPVAACPSLRAEATACAAPSAHCSAACRS